MTMQDYKDKANIFQYNYLKDKLLPKNNLYWITNNDKIF